MAGRKMEDKVKSSGVDNVTIIEREFSTCSSLFHRDVIDVTIELGAGVWSEQECGLAHLHISARA